MPVAVIRGTEVGFLWLKQTQIENKKTIGKPSKESFWLHKTNLSVLNITTGTFSLHFQSMWLEV